MDRRSWNGIAPEFGITLSSDNAFAAGNSLGGYGAEYISSVYGWGGAGVGHPGLVGYNNPNAGNLSIPANFVSYCNTGDLVCNYSTDPLQTQGSAAGDGSINYFNFAPGGMHVGQVVMAPSGSQSGLQTDLAFAQPWSASADWYNLTTNYTLPSLSGAFVGMGGLLGSALTTHLLPDYAASLGVNLTQKSPSSLDSLDSSFLPLMLFGGNSGDGSFNLGGTGNKLTFSTTGTLGTDSGTITSSGDGSGNLTFNTSLAGTTASSGSLNWQSGGIESGVLDYFSRAGAMDGSVSATYSNGGTQVNLGFNQTGVGSPTLDETIGLNSTGQIATQDFSSTSGVALDATTTYNGTTQQTDLEFIDNGIQSYFNLAPSSSSPGAIIDPLRGCLEMSP